jgi:rfaE bifunctional protein kinase chain/domain/rfaE bifunctional protein nucleotidyltransferase chain/domain
MSKIVKLSELLETLDRSKKVILACGCFDVVHPGHIRHLAYAKSKADILVVSLTADRHINKGIYRPHVPENIRAESLAALEMVDYVIIDQNADHLINIAAIKPDYFVKGFEYSDLHHEATRAETSLVESYGGEMIFTPGDVVYSSTKLLNTHLPKLQIEKLASLMKQFDITFGGLKDAISSFENYKIHVIGDTIIDTYTRTNLVGSNAKTPTFSVLYDGHEDYVGGAAIVAKHLKTCGAKVSFTTVLGADSLGTMATESLRSDGVVANIILDATRPTTQKNTIIAGDYRLLKIDKLDNSSISGKAANQIQGYISVTPADAVIFSDFRHGIFNRTTIPYFMEAIMDDIFTVADSQVASRWGNITEFKGFDLITPNEKEARFALADQDSNIGSLISSTKKAAEAKNVLMKLGSRGLFFLQDEYPYSLDSFAHCVKDAVGAGDALLAYATLTMLATKSLPMACIMGSIAAACECEIDGNMPIKPEQVLQKLQQLEKAI